MTPDIPQRPVPLPDVRSAGYWAAIADGRLAIQRCAACRRWHHPPVAACEHCHSVDLAYSDVRGAGVIHQRVIVHQTKITGFQNATPYVAATVELSEQPGLFVVGNIVDVAPDEVTIGQRVQVVFEPTDHGLIAQFRLDEGQP